MRNLPRKGKSFRESDAEEEEGRRNLSHNSYTKVLDELSDKTRKRHAQRFRASFSKETEPNLGYPSEFRKAFGSAPYVFLSEPALRLVGNHLEVVTLEEGECLYDYGQADTLPFPLIGVLQHHANLVRRLLVCLNRNPDPMRGRWLVLYCA